MSHDLGQTADHRAQLGLSSFSVLYAYLFCMMVSNTLVNMPIAGGALFLLGRVATVYARFGQKKSGKLLSAALRRTGYILIISVFAITLILVMIYPSTLSMPTFWLLLGIVFSITLREVLAKRLLYICAEKCCTNVQLTIRILEMHILILIPLTVLLFFSLNLDTAIYLFGGYLLSAVLEIYAMLTDRKIEQTQESLKTEYADSLHEVYAYNTFQKAALLTNVAIQITLVLAYTFIGCSANDLLYCMVVAFICTYASREATKRLLRRSLTKDRDPGNMLLVGFGLWLCGLLLLSQYVALAKYVESYIALILCSCGATVTITVLAHLEEDVRRVAAFAIGHPPAASFDYMRKVQMEFASLIGQTLALIGLAFISYFYANSFPNSIELLLDSIKPMLLMPAFLFVFLALLATFKFPMTKHHLAKLRRFLLLKDNGETNLSLQKQLEDVIVKYSHKHYGMKLLMAVMRPFYYHKICGRENVSLEEGAGSVFVCNHGELYGPIVTNLYIPYSFRPWVISELLEPEELTDYIYQFTFIRQKWIVPRLKRPIAKLFTPIIVWGMKSIESIPVYRDKPRELIRTFRITASALDAGDNVLIFPENPHSEHQEKPGYLRDSVGDFSSGFTMLAPIFHTKTGKCLQFIPIYADKKQRKLTFGKPIRFDPDALPVPEKERIVRHLRNEMIRLSKSC